MRAPVSRTDRNFSFKYARMCSPHVYLYGVFLAILFVAFEQILIDSQKNIFERAKSEMTLHWYLRNLSYSNAILSGTSHKEFVKLPEMHCRCRYFRSLLFISTVMANSLISFPRSEQRLDGSTNKIFSSLSLLDVTFLLRLLYHFYFLTSFNSVICLIYIWRKKMHITQFNLK